MNSSSKTINKQLQYDEENRFKTSVPSNSNLFVTEKRQYWKPSDWRLPVFSFSEILVVGRLLEILVFDMRVTIF